MADDQRRTARPPGAFGGGREDRREERLLDDVRREIRREVAAIRDEVAHAVARKLTEGWERLEHMLAQQAEEAKKQAEEAKKQAEEDRKWRWDVARRLEALEQAFRVGSAFQRSEEERGKAVERGTKRARVESEGTITVTCGEGRTTPEAPRRAPAIPQHQGGLARHQGEGLAQSQHAPRGGEKPAQPRQAPKQKAAGDTPMPGLGAVRMPKPTYANIASQPASNTSTAPRRPSDGDGFTTVGKNGRARKESQAIASGPGDLALKPITRGNTEDDRKVIFPRDGLTPHPPDNAKAIHSEVNRALHKAGVPAHVRLAKLRRNENGVLTGLVEDKTNARQFLRYADLILLAARKADPGVIAVESNETWARLKIHGVQLRRYMRDDPAEGLQLLREEIEAENPGVQIPTAGWLVAPRWIKERWLREEIKSSSVVLAVKDRAVADRLRTKGLKAAGVYYAVERYVAEGPDVICARCCTWGHIEEKCNHPTPRCMWCAGNHRSSDHRCLVTVCSAKPGDRCKHVTEECCNCGGNHNARSKHCPRKIEAIRRAKALRSGGSKEASPSVKINQPPTETSGQEPTTGQAPAATGNNSTSPQLLLIEAPEPQCTSGEGDDSDTSSLSSLPSSDMEVDETQH
jgi:ElaB/YqjD/DUF883 family membrane-anchored ribosome-binding protein